MKHFRAVLVALFVIGGLVMGVQSWQDSKREERCTQQRVDRSAAPDDGLSPAVDADC